MKESKSLTVDRRSFLKISGVVSGGLVLGFTWGSCTSAKDVVVMPENWYDINAFIKIGENGIVTIMSPNPEIGQNIKTSMPMIVAEELDVPWKNVIVEQAPFDINKYTRQLAGGSQSIRQGWTSLRTIGGIGRKILINTAAKKWEVDPTNLKTEDGYVVNSNGEKLSYGELSTMATRADVFSGKTFANTAARIWDVEVTKLSVEGDKIVGTEGKEMSFEELASNMKSRDLADDDKIQLKDPNEFKLIGTDVSNVDIDRIISGEALFGIDTKKEGMVYASVLRPPAFGQKLANYDDSETKMVNGVENVVQFGDKIAVIANSNWAAMKGKSKLKAEWTADEELESTEYHDQKLLELLNTKAEEPRRHDGDFYKALAEADEVLERTYEAPFLPHNCMEPMNFYADVREDVIELIGPIQTPEWTAPRVADELGRAPEEIKLEMTRMGGGFGRRLYGDFAVEAALISDKIKKPVQLQYTRDDDMTAGTYRPASKYKFQATIKDGQFTGYHLVGAGINMRNATFQNRFPAGTVDNYLIESHNLRSNITTGAWRAPVTNFLAFAEQAFFDELALKLGKDPVDFRLELFERAKNNPVGEIEYDAEKSIGVIKLAAEKSNWGQKEEGRYKGFSTYYSHNTYVAEVAEAVIENGMPKVDKVIVAVDCGIVINPLGAKNQIEGGVVDGIGHAMYGDFSFEAGKPKQKNFDSYKMIRMGEAPKVEAHFVENYDDPTGLGEPSLPPAGGALANAFFAANGKRMYKQPFINDIEVVG